MTDPLVAKAFRMLYPDKYDGQYTFVLEYSGRFNDYNANVRYSRDTFTFNLSKKWKAIDEEITIGLIQSLLNRVQKTKKSTPNIELYNIFVKRLHKVVPKTRSDPLLAESFARVNDLYFDGIIEQPNLVWGQSSFRTLGHYAYTTDTVTISSILREDPELLDYVMYHELLHKKLKFDHSTGRSRYHTREFKREERRFRDAEILERRLASIARKSRVRSWFGF